MSDKKNAKLFPSKCFQILKDVIRGVIFRWNDGWRWKWSIQVWIAGRNICNRWSNVVYSFYAGYPKSEIRTMWGGRWSEFSSQHSTLKNTMYLRTQSCLWTHNTVREIEKLHRRRFKLHQVETSSVKIPACKVLEGSCQLPIDIIFFLGAKLGE